MMSTREVKIRVEMPKFWSKIWFLTKNKIKTWKTAKKQKIYFERYPKSQLQGIKWKSLLIMCG